MQTLIRFKKQKTIQQVVLMCFYCMTLAHAETDMNLAKTVENPLGVNPEARHFTLPFVNYTNFEEGEKQHTQNILDIKPVTPFPLTPSFDLIFRTIIPLTHQPIANGYANGLGDINPTAFITPSENRCLLWGAGPTLVIPTATNRNLGAGKWSLGPELVLIMMPKEWAFALLTYNVWSVAGQANRLRVNQLTFQYYITYNFQHGWYITTQPTLTANWVADPSQVWTVPFGGGAGRAFHAGRQALNFSLQGYTNPIRPATGQHWTLQATFEWLFDDKRTA